MSLSIVHLQLNRYFELIWVFIRVASCPTFGSKESHSWNGFYPIVGDLHPNIFNLKSHYTRLSSLVIRLWAASKTLYTNGRSIGLIRNIKPIKLCISYYLQREKGENRLKKNVKIDFHCEMIVFFVCVFVWCSPPNTVNYRENWHFHWARPMQRYHLSHKLRRKDT